MGFWGWLFGSKERPTPRTDEDDERQQKLLPFQNDQLVAGDLAPETEYTLAKLKGAEAELRLRVHTGGLPDSVEKSLIKSGVNVTTVLGSFGPSINAAIQSGHLVQIVGRPELLTGLSNGSMYLMQNSTGATLMVQNTAGGFAGHLNVASVGAMKIAGPLIIFQAMSLVTGQYFFNRLDQQLKEVRNQLDRIEAHQRFEGIAKLIAYRREAERIATELRINFTSSHHAPNFDAAVQFGLIGARLDELIKQVDVELERSMLWMQRFETAVSGLRELAEEGGNIDDELNTIKSDLPRYEEAYALAGSWLDLAAALQELGRIYDARVNGERLSLRETWKAEYVERAETHADSTAFSDLLKLAKKREKEFKGSFWSFKWFTRQFKRGAKSNAVALRAYLEQRSMNEDQQVELPAPDTINLIRVGDQVFAMAEQPAAPKAPVEN